MPVLDQCQKRLAYPRWVVFVEFYEYDLRT